MRFPFGRTVPAIVVLGLLIAACDDGGPSGDEPPAFALSAAEIVFSDETQQRDVTISNLWNGPLEWRVVSSTAAWLSVSPSTGVVGPGASETLAVQVDRAVVPEGTHSAILEIGAAGQSAFVLVSVQEAAPTPAVALLHPGVVTMGPLDTSARVEVENSGGATLEWTATGPSWAVLAPISGTLASGERSQILVSPVRAGLTDGRYLGTLQLSSNGGSPTVALELEVGGVAGLGLDPERLDFGATTDRLLMQVRNDSDQTLQWSARSTAPWATVSPAVGTLSPRSTQLLTVDISRSQLPTGHHEAALDFTSNGGSAVAIVSADLLPPDDTNPSPPTPRLTVTPTLLDFRQDATQLGLSLHNEGAEPVEWSAQPEVSWISLSASTGVIAPLSDATVVVGVSRSGLSPGSYQSSLRFVSDIGVAVATISATVGDAPSPDPDPEPPSASIRVTPTALDFGLAGTELPIVIENPGEAPLDWTAVPARAYISVSPSAGRIGPGASESARVVVSRSGLLTPGSYDSSIRFESNGGTHTLPITLSVAGDPPGGEGPIEARALASGEATDVSSVTASLSAPLPDALLLTWVGSATESPTNIPVVSGAGVIWELVATHVREGSVRRFSVFRAVSSTAAPGPLRIDFQGQQQQALGWGVVQYTGVDVSGGNGASAIVQIGVGAAEGFETVGMIDLAPFSSSNNAVVGGFLSGTGAEITPGDGFEEVLEVGPLRRRVMVEFRPSPDTSVDAVWPDGAHWLGIALELQARSGS